MYWVYYNPILGQRCALHRELGCTRRATCFAQCGPGPIHSRQPTVTPHSPGGAPRPGHGGDPREIPQIGLGTALAKGAACLPGSCHVSALYIGINKPSAPPAP